MASLVRIMGDFERCYLLGKQTTLGRAPENVIQLEDPLVSRFHAEVIREPGGEHRIIDKGSLHGTFVLREKISEKGLNDGDEIFIGATRFYYHREYDNKDTRRWEERISCDLPALLDREFGDSLEGQITDVSMSGLRLLSLTPLAPGELLQLRIDFSEEQQIMVTARVMHYNPTTQTAGVLCVFGDEDSRRFFAEQVAILLRNSERQNTEEIP